MRLLSAIYVRRSSLFFGSGVGSHNGYASLHGRTLLGAANADTGCLAPCVIYADAWTPNFSNRRIGARTI